MGFLTNLFSGMRTVYHQGQVRRVIKDAGFAQAVKDVWKQDANTKVFLEAEKHYKTIMFDANKKGYISQDRIREAVDLLDKGRFAEESGGRGGLLISYTGNLHKLLDEQAKTQRQYNNYKPGMQSFLERRNRYEDESNTFLTEQSEAFIKAKQLYANIIADAEKKIPISPDQIREAIVLFHGSRFAPEYSDASDKSRVLHNAYVHKLRELLEDKNQARDRAVLRTSREVWEIVCANYPKAMVSKDIYLVKQTLADARSGAYCTLESLLTLDVIKSNLYTKLAEVERVEHEQDEAAILIAAGMYEVIKYDVERNLPICGSYVKKSLDLFDKVKHARAYVANEDKYTKYYNFLLMREKNQAILKIRARMQ